LFNNLLESKAKRQRTLGGFIFSVTFHAAVITAAAYATLHATQQKEKREEKVEFVEVKKAEPPKPPPIMEAPPPPKGFQTVVAITEIPTEIPPVNLNERFDPRTAKRQLGRITAAGTSPSSPTQG